MIEKNFKNLRKQFAEQGVFYTPPELVNFMFEIAKRYNKENPKNVYDPTLGAGYLFNPFSDDIPKFGQELDGTQVEIARNRLKNFTGVVGDTLKEPAFQDMKFDLIMSNYPFSVKWDEKVDWRFEDLPVLPPASRADFAFIVHCLKYLEEDGVAVVMGHPGTAYRKARELKIRKWLVDNNYISEVIKVPGNKFTDTAIETIIYILQKNKTTTDIIFNDSENNIVRVVPYEEVVEKDYTLTTSTYIEIVREKEEIDIRALETSILNDKYKDLKNNIELDRFIRMELNFDNPPEEIERRLHEFNKFLKDIINLCKRSLFTQKEISDISQKIKIEIPRNMLLEMMEESMQKTMFRF